VKAWFNAHLIDFHETKVHLLSHSFSRASAIFEVLEIVATEKGPAFFCLDEHLERFIASASATYMHLPVSRDELKKALGETARANGIQKGIAKFYAYYPEIELSTIPSNRQVDIAIFCLGYDERGVAQEDLGKPVSLGISSFRKIDPQTTPVHAKVVGNYVNGYLAKIEVGKRGYDEALLLDTKGFIAEGPSSNIFFVKGSRVETPTLENVLPGITRAVLIEVLRDMGYQVSETHIRLEDLDQYHEAFLSGTTNHVQPIRSLEASDLICPGPVTSAIRNQMEMVRTGRIPDYQKWLSYIL
jgi:branched-chain amino acid aminotransferase